MITLFHILTFALFTAGLFGGLLCGMHYLSGLGGLIGDLIGAYIGLISGRLICLMFAATLRRN